jgi:hypothetical protein
MVWSQCAGADVQLKQRHDLMPNLVETVNGYAKHERDTLQNVIKWAMPPLRARATSSASVVWSTVTSPAVLALIREVDVQFD